MPRRWINRVPARGSTLVLGILPVLFLLAIYLTTSHLRLTANPGDRLLPAPSTMLETMLRLATEPDPRTGALLFWADNFASLGRLFGGMAIAAAGALSIGVAVGLLPVLRALLQPLLAVLALIPPLAMLPILLVVLGIGEAAKVALVAIGTAPQLLRDLALRVEALPREQIVKMQTLGASGWQIALRAVIPQVLPAFLDSVRLQLGAAWLFLIAAEALGATEGLGYRIFLVRRYFAMDVILPYVAWITLLACLLDLLIRALSARLFPWVVLERRT